MRWLTLYDAVAIATFMQHARATQEFVINNGQIFTPGFAILNSPQPETPMGGGKLGTAATLVGKTDKFSQILFTYH